MKLVDPACLDATTRKRGSSTIQTAKNALKDIGRICLNSPPTATIVQLADTKTWPALRVRANRVRKVSTKRIRERENAISVTQVKPRQILGKLRASTVRKASSHLNPLARHPSCAVRLVPKVTPNLTRASRYVSSANRVVLPFPPSSPVVKLARRVVST